MHRIGSVLLIGFCGALVFGCADSADSDFVPDSAPDGQAPDGQISDGQTPDIGADIVPASASSVYDFAHACVAISTQLAGAPRWLSSLETGEAAEAAGYEFGAETAESAAVFRLHPSDLGTYLLYDAEAGYLVAESGPMLRHKKLQSDVYLIDDSYVSGAEWHLQVSEKASLRYRLQNRRTGQYLGAAGLVADVADSVDLELVAADECAEHPEMALNATGHVQKTQFDDGDIFGFADTHSHLLSNFGFGGGGVFHGSPFHRLGVEHAMGDCAVFHNTDGRSDLLGWGFGNNASTELDTAELIGLLTAGQLAEPLHDTDGWPTFSYWPAQWSATHQTQYYRWLERAWMAGLRLVVQHAVSNEVFCALMAETGYQPVRWDCDDMFNIDRQLIEIRNMERYIDAQVGGPGEGWFRVVESPAEARDVIAQGKMAVVLGIEVPNLFSCYLTPKPDSPVCDAEHISAQLDYYRDQGVRVLFPNHKFDNAFTPGDGHRGLIEVGNFLQTGHWSNFVQDCPDTARTYDKGPVRFGGFNKPRDEYLSPAPNELIDFAGDLVGQFLPYFEAASAPPLEGDWCQKATLTEAGETLIQGIMQRGMIAELDHLPRRSYQAAFELLAKAQYPGAAGTHGNTNDGKLYDLGGISKSNFRRCADPNDPNALAESFRHAADEIEAAGGYPAQGFGFDLNGLAPLPGPRFGPNAECDTEQKDPVEYPFVSFAGDVEFQAPAMGERQVDFNTEGFIHIGLVAELIEDARRTGVSDADLEILFRSAEGYIRMWERAEARAEELRDGQ